MHTQRAISRTTLLLCLCTAIWFALGGAVKVLVAKSSGRTIEMVVCSGSGIKKIYIHLQSAESTDSEVSVKHCSNTPLALAPAEWHMPAHLGFVAPRGMNISIYASAIPIDRSWARNGRPPPGRAPPLIFQA